MPKHRIHDIKNVKVGNFIHIKSEDITYRLIDNYIGQYNAVNATDDTDYADSEWYADLLEYLEGWVISWGNDVEFYSITND